jgi:hypothetical protein
MALIIEDGSIVANADSYVTTAEITAYANKRGFTVPTSESDLEMIAILAIDYMQSKKYIGNLVESDQALAFPRREIEDLADDVIPQAIKNAQIELAIAAHTNDLLMSEPTATVQSESTGTTSTTYLGGLTTEFVSARVNMFLSQYLRPYAVNRV